METINPKYLKPQPTLEQARERLTEAGIKYTRKDYMDGKLCDHVEYGDQFVTNAVVQFVVHHFGKKRLLASTDKWFNDIPLAEWDRLSEHMPQHFWWNIALSNMFTYANAVPAISLADKVGLLKHAARKVREEG